MAPSSALSIIGPAAVKVTGGFLKTVTGEVGALVKDKISARRFRNLIPIVIEAKRQLANAGLSPHEVPLKIIHPLLEAASLEEDESLRERWAALLANSARSDDSGEILASFPAILKELSSREVRFLSALYQQVEAKTAARSERPCGRSSYQASQPRSELGIWGSYPILTKMQDSRALSAVNGCLLIPLLN